MKKIIILMFGLFLGTFAIAQNSIWSLNYDMAMPFGDAKDYTDQVSFRGLSIDGRYFINDNILIGGTIGWNLFYEKEKDVTQTWGNTTIHGTQWRYINNTPIYVTGAYCFGDPGEIRTLIGLGVGTIWSERRLDIGVYEYSSNDWLFALAPEVGVIIPMSGNVNATIKMKYNNGFKTSDMESLQYFGFSVGLSWTNYFL